MTGRPGSENRNALATAVSASRGLVFFGCPMARECRRIVAEQTSDVDPCVLHPPLPARHGDTNGAPSPLQRCAASRSALPGRRRRTRGESFARGANAPRPIPAPALPRTGRSWRRAATVCCSPRPPPRGAFERERPARAPPAGARRTGFSFEPEMLRQTHSVDEPMLAGDAAASCVSYKEREGPACNWRAVAALTQT